jgi:hypothetical protein
LRTGGGVEIVIKVTLEITEWFQTIQQSVNVYFITTISNWHNPILSLFRRDLQTYLLPLNGSLCYVNVIMNICGIISSFEVMWLWMSMENRGIERIQAWIKK